MVHKHRGSPRFYASVAIPGRRTLRVAGFRKRKLTERLERELETLAALRSDGERPDRELQAYLDGLPERIQRRLAVLGLMDAGGPSKRLVDVLGEEGDGAAPGEYEGYLLAKGDTPKHARQQARRARRVLIDHCGFALVSDITADPVLRALADLRAGSKGAEPVSATTSNAYRQACRGVTRWLTREGRLPADPLAFLERVKAESDSGRRAPMPEEQAKLIGTTRSQPVRQGLSGEARSVLYLLALATGLRRAELLSLKRSNFEFDGRIPTVTITHGHAKNRRTARIPLQPETAAVMRGFLTDALPAALVFRGARRDYRSAEVLREDLAAAGIPEVTEAGRLDFHCLRSGFITNLARGGVPLAQAQKLARHCSPVLTANTYSRFGFDEDAAAIGRLPHLAGAAGGPRNTRAFQPGSA